MTVNISEVQEIIKNLESGGELSIKEEKYLKVAKLCVQLAAENMSIKAMNDCLSEELRGYESDGAFEGPKMHLLWWRVETPATDRFVAGIKADGASEFISRLQQCVDEGDFVGDEVAVIVGAIDCGKEFCEQLREGAEK